MKPCSKTFSAHRPRRLSADLTAFFLFLFSAVAAAQLPIPELGHKLHKFETPAPAPDFELEDMDGDTQSLADYRGQVVMLNFWATWCPPCRREIPSMEALYQRFQDEPFTVLAVNEWENSDMVFPYLGQLDVFPNFPILFDQDGSVAEAYSVKGLPTTLLIDKQGRVVYRAIGGRDYEHPEVLRILEEMIAAPADAAAIP